MLEFQQKRNIKNILYSKFSLVILFLLIIFLAHSTYGIYIKSKLSTEGYDKVKNQYEDLNNRKIALESEIDRLNSDIGIEEELRSKFNVAKPGETVVVVVDDKNTEQDLEKNLDNNFWEFWNWFR
jgi:cell division protein FtsB